MKPVLTALLFAGFAFGQFDAVSNIPYCINTTCSNSHTATGTNLVAVMYVWNDTSTPSSVTYGGVSFGAPVTSHAVTVTYAGTVFAYVLTGVLAGTSTVSFVCSGQCAGTIITYNGAKQSGQPDAIGTFTASSTSAGGYCTYAYGSFPITTVATGSWVSGWFGNISENFGITYSPSSISEAQTASTNNAIGYVWWSINGVTPAGSLTMPACTLGAGDTYNALGISIAPAVLAFPYSQGGVF